MTGWRAALTESALNEPFRRRLVHAAGSTYRRAARSGQRGDRSRSLAD